MTDATTLVRPADAVSIAAEALTVSDGLWIDNGGYAGAGRIVSIASDTKPSGYRTYDLVLATSAGELLHKRVTSLHRGLYRASSLTC